MKDIAIFLDNTEMSEKSKEVEWWSVSVYRGVYSKASQECYAVELVSKTRTEARFVFLLRDFVTNFAKKVFPEISNSGLIDTDILKKLKFQVELKLRSDIDENSEVIVLDASKGETIDNLLNGGFSEHSIDRYYNHLVDALQKNAHNFPEQTNNTATCDSKAVWLNKPLYISRNKAVYLAIRENAFAELIGWNKDHGIDLSAIRDEFVERGYILKGTGKMISKDLTLGSHAKNVRCLVLNITPTDLGLVGER